MRFVIIAFSVCTTLSTCQPQTPPPPNDYPLIPQPGYLQEVPGTVTFTEEIGIAFQHSEEMSGLMELIKSYFDRAAIPILALPASREINTNRPVIQLMLVDSDTLGSEGYSLAIDETGVKIKAQKEAGIFYGIQTLRQLASFDQEANLVLPYVVLADKPRFSWRGMHLDVCRHFFTVDEVKQYLDYLAMYKFNRFHWHLTEDQGWRIQIDRYPRLTEVGAWRDSTMIGHHRDQPRTYDDIRYGGFYTKEEVREVVAYAAQRYITVVPEIEMPGHAQAAIASYPELGVTGKPVSVKAEWGISADIYNVEETTFDFLKNVLTEVMELFPGPYIHIGGDEAAKDLWQKSPDIQAAIRKHGLKDEAELQSWFIQRIDSFLTSHDKKMIGWDEILEGGLSPNAIVMSWRGINGAIAAAKSGHQAIMSPTDYCYFDYYQSEDRESEPTAIGGHLPVEKVYSFNPIPQELTPDQHDYILGAQANVWTEYITTFDHVEYMIFPRMLAMSEVVWSLQSKRDYQDFISRVKASQNRLDRMGVNYARHVFENNGEE